MANYGELLKAYTYNASHVNQVANLLLIRPGYRLDSWTCVASKYFNLWNHTDLNAIGHPSMHYLPLIQSESWWKQIPPWRESTSFYPARLSIFLMRYLFSVFWSVPGPCISWMYLQNLQEVCWSGILISAHVSGATASVRVTRSNWSQLRDQTKSDSKIPDGTVLFKMHHLAPIRETRVSCWRQIQDGSLHGKSDSRGFSVTQICTASDANYKNYYQHWLLTHIRNHIHLIVEFHKNVL